MNNEFKKIKSNNETRYVLETASAGATSSGAIATAEKPLGELQKRQSVSVPVTQKPRQGPLRPQTGGGAHRDKKKEQKQGKEKHRKPFAENINTDSGAEDFRDFANFYNDPNPNNRRPPEAEEAIRLITAQGQNPKVTAQNIVNYAQANPDAVEDVMNPEELADAIEQLKLLIGQGVGENFSTDTTQPTTWHGHRVIANRKTAKGGFLILKNKNDGKYEIHKHNPGVMGGVEFVSAHNSPEEMQAAFKKLTGIDEGSMKPDHEISMASNELQSIVSDAKKLLMLVKRYSEMEGLEAWQQSKITKAADYLNSVFQSIGGDQNALEGLRDPKDNPCWKGYKPVGTKQKGGRTVPNCVPKEGVDVEESGLQYYTGVKKHGKEYMVKAAQAARNGASQKELGALKDKYSKAYKEEIKKEEVGHDEVSPKSARYILRKMEQGVPMSSILEDFPELYRMMEIIAGEQGLHMDDDIEDIEASLYHDLEDIADEKEPDEYMESLSQYLQSALNEKAVSKAQQRFMGMVHAAKKGEKAASPEVAKAAKGMSKKDAKDFAATKHKGLPEKKKSKK